MNTELFTDFNPETEELENLIESKIKYYDTLPADAKNRKFLAREIQTLQRCHVLLLQTNLAYCTIETDVAKTIKAVAESPQAARIEGILFFYAMQPKDTGRYGMLALHTNDRNFQFNPVRMTFDEGDTSYKEYVTFEF